MAKCKGCGKDRKLRALSEDDLQTYYFELEEDAINEAADLYDSEIDDPKVEKKATKLLKDPIWIKNEIHDMKIRHKLSDDEANDIKDFMLK